MRVGTLYRPSHRPGEDHPGVPPLSDRTIPPRARRVVILSVVRDMYGMPECAHILLRAIPTMFLMARTRRQALLIPMGGLRLLYPEHDRLLKEIYELAPGNGITKCF